MVRNVLYGQRDQLFRAHPSIGAPEQGGNHGEGSQERRGFLDVRPGNAVNKPLYVLDTVDFPA